MTRLQLHVTLVVDPNFGDRAAPLAEVGPLWMIDSPANRPVMEALWARAEGQPSNDLTLINAVRGRSAEDTVVESIGTADEHHPNWTVFEIVGITVTERILAMLSRLADGTVQNLPLGFIFSRTGFQS
jgi:hypothetical protein